MCWSAELLRAEEMLALQLMAVTYSSSAHSTLDIACIGVVSLFSNLIFCASFPCPSHLSSPVDYRQDD